MNSLMRVLRAVLPIILIYNESWAMSQALELSPAQTPSANFTTPQDFSIDKTSWNPLHHAAYEGDTETCMVLVKSGVNVNAVTNKGRAPLHLAAYNGHTGTCLALIRSGASVITNGLTALQCAAYNGHTKTCLALIQRGANVNTANQPDLTAVFCAANKGHTETCLALIKSGADVAQALIGAATAGHTETCLALIKNGANINSIDTQSRSALHQAASHHHADTCLALIRNGAKVDAINIDGRTPLQCAAFMGHTNVVTALIPHSLVIPQRANEISFINRMWSRFNSLLTSNNPHSRIKTALFCMYRLPRLPKKLYSFILRSEQSIADDVFQILLPRIQKGYEKQQLFNSMKTIPLLIPLCAERICDHTIEYVKKDLIVAIQKASITQEQKAQIMKIIETVKENHGRELYQNIYNQLTIPSKLKSE